MNTYTSLADALAHMINNTEQSKIITEDRNPVTFDIGTIGLYFILNDYLSKEECNTYFFERLNGFVVEGDKYASLCNSLIACVLTPETAELELSSRDFLAIYHYMEQNNLMSEKELESLEALIDENVANWEQPPKIDDDFVFVDDKENN